ncbi:DNA alkylation repair protein [uncultured Bacteroides sp.]|uniref:DNA alkylation repair protein n=1 Tax=uncultured Bacteroides sp. TaxID=162156 RepID=UPI002AAC4210|nr:DNA alkylation repair protein [uncultured Bacteroides sp.]
MDTKEIIKEIKTQLRLAMNGVASQSMREKGLTYKLNFGVELPRLKEIAKQYDQNHDLAQTLWKENVRESKILAGMLQPIDTFFPEIADIWVEDIQNTEIAELTCMNLFQYLPYAPAKSFQWMADEREYVQACGFLLVARLLAKGGEMNERAEEEFFDQALAALLSSSYFSRKTASLALKKYGMQSKSNTEKVIQLLAKEEDQKDEEIKSLFENIKLEIEYLL